MDIVNLKFVADTSDLDKAEKQLDTVGKKTTEVAQAAEKDTKGLTDALGKFSEIPGPIGDVANKLIGIGDTAKAAFSAISTTVGGLTGVSATASTATGTTGAFTTALGASTLATAAQTTASGSLALANSAVAASTIEAADAQRKWKDDLNSLARQVYGLGRASGLSADEARKLRNAVTSVYDRQAYDSGLKEQITGIGKEAEHSASLVSRLGLALRGLASAGPALAAFGLLAGAGGIGAALNFSGALDDIGDLAAKLGLTASQAQLVKQEMADAGVGVETYQNALQRASVALSKAGEEGKAASEALKTLGVSVNDSTEPTRLLTDLTEKYSEQLKTGSVSADELAALQLVLGKNFRESMIAVTAFADAQKRANEFQQLGIGISEEGLTATGELQKANKDLSFILGAVGSKLVAEVVPAFTGLINAMVDSYKNGGLVKIAFDSIRVATQVLMVPIRALFNIFIQLDAAIQSVGKSIGALFAAIATRSTNPFRELGADLAKIWEDANKRTTGPWAWDSGQTAAPQTMTVTPPTGGGGGGGGKGGGDKMIPGKDADGPYKAYLAMLDEKAKRELEDLKRYEEREAAAQAEYESMMKLVQGYTDMAEPVNRYIREQLQIEMLMERFPQYAEGLWLAWNKIQDKIDETMKTTSKASVDMELLSRIGQTAFKGLEDQLVSLATTGKFSFRAFVASLLQDIARLIIQMKVILPLMSAFKAWMGGGDFWGTFMKGVTGSANGNVFAPSGLVKSANGNVFDGPVMHGFKGGIGVLGEAGPEAVMPLKRTASGKLGVVAEGGGGGISIGTIQVNVQGGQTNAETGQAVSKAVVDTMKRIADGQIVRARQPGGLLYA